MATPPLPVWAVYSADRHLVASYSTQEAAASHVAAWPALYYVLERRLPMPAGSPIGPSSPTSAA